MPRNKLFYVTRIAAAFGETPKFEVCWRDRRDRLAVVGSQDAADGMIRMLTAVHEAGYRDGVIDAKGGKVK